MLRLGIILLTAITAGIHLSLLFPNVGFTLNALGYLGLLAALYLPLARLDDYRWLARWALLGYTALTIVLWVVMGQRGVLGYLAKADELALIALLLIDAWRAPARAPGSA